MNSINKICVVGRLVRDPELKTLENGTKVCNVTLAADRDYKDKDGNKITDFLDFALWNKMAERISEFSHKGDLVFLEGYNTTKKIETEKGKISVMQPVIESYKNLAKAKTDDVEITKDTETEMEK